MNVLSLDRKIAVVACLCEGNGARATSRLTNVNRETVGKLTVTVGQGCARLHDALMRDLNVALLELDEAWSYIHTKQKRVRDDDPDEYGDQYVFIGLAATQKAIVSYRVGKRTAENTQAFVADLRRRILNRPQITSDGFVPYIDAVDLAFGCDVDYAMLQKQYAGEPAADAARRYSPGWIIGAEKQVVMGAPDMRLCSTSYVERSNLSLRMHLRRFTRLTNGFSKRLDNHVAAVSLYVAFYNLCRVHETLRITPAMALGVTDHVWTIAELVQAASAMPVAPVTPPAAPPSPPVRKYPLRPFTVIEGGRGA